MLRSTRKLVIRAETIRALTQMELGVAAGANPNVQLAGTGGPETGCPFVRAERLFDTGGAGTGCPSPRLFDTGGAVTGCPIK